MVNSQFSILNSQFHRLAIFASGGGSNARKIIEHFEKRADPRLKVALLVSNKANAGALDIAREHGIPTLVLERATFYQTEDLLADLQRFGVDFIALAGFLWLVPPYLVRAFPRKMVNIHPALLPKFGGKGMFGHQPRIRIMLSSFTWSATELAVRSTSMSWLPP